MAQSDLMAKIQAEANASAVGANVDSSSSQTDDSASQSANDLDTDDIQSQIIKSQMAEAENNQPSQSDDTTNLDPTQDGQIDDNSILKHQLNQLHTASANATKPSATSKATSSSVASSKASSSSSVATSSSASSVVSSAVSENTSASVSPETKSYLTMRDRKSAFIANLTSSSATKLINSYQASLATSASNEFPLSPKQMHFDSVADTRYKLYQADPTNQAKPKTWVIKGYKEYHSANRLKTQLNKLVAYKSGRYSKHLHNILTNKSLAQAKQDLALITNKREFTASEHRLAKAPTKVVQDYKHHQEHERETHINDTYSLQYGMANIMYRKGQFNDTEFLSALDSIKAQTEIKQSHPSVHNVKDMMKYANEAQPIIDNNIGGIYDDKNVQPTDVINNPLLDKVNQNLNTYRKEAKYYAETKFNLQRPIFKGITHQQNTDERQHYLTKSNLQLRRYAKYTSQTDPEIRKVHRQLIKRSRQVGGYYPQGYRSLIKKHDMKVNNDMFMASLHSYNVAKALYPNQPKLVQHINDNLYSARFAVYRHKPFKQYMTPKTQRVFNAYYLAKKQHVLADVHPQVPVTTNQPSRKAKFKAFRNKVSNIFSKIHNNIKKVKPITPNASSQSKGQKPKRNASRNQSVSR